MSRVAQIFLILALVLVMSGCGGVVQSLMDSGASDDGGAPSQEGETQEGETGAVSSLEDVEQATVRIQASGTFVDPGEGVKANAQSSGSGFIIDPSGLAVTNNHVVTGAALLKVFVSGEDEPRNARVLGASECSDLALIDIDGDDFPYLTWHDGDVKVGMDVSAAGYPLGDENYTLYKGTVSKARADGETDWASVDSVIETDAKILPGNSGGPLVDGEGAVVGINYAGNQEEQHFAIGRDEALPLIEQLREGDTTSIGINGQAFVIEGEEDDSDVSGIWVSSVKSGSPADDTGVKPGDIIMTIERLAMATDGTMSDYCDILRSHRPDEPLNIQVLRFDTKEMLEGQLNGKPLSQLFSFEEDLQDEVESDTSGGTEAATYAEYTTVQDESKQLELEVPAEWDDVNGGAWTLDDAEVGVAVSASPDLDAFHDTWGEPGVFFGASRSLVEDKTPDDLLDSLGNLEGTCKKVGREDYESGNYSGKFDVWSGCDDEEVIFVVLAAMPADKSHMIFAQMQMISDADAEAMDHILSTFKVDSDLR